MEHRTLVLTKWFFPYQILGWQDAITQVYTGDAVVVAEYGDEVRSPSVTWLCPAVIRLTTNVRPTRKAKFSRFNVFTRDHFTCQYCGKQKKMAELTYDHMIPRKRGGRTVWDNIVTACKPCNSRKGSKTCDEVGMFPKNLPVKPKSLPLVPPIRDLSRAPEEWHDYVKPFLPAYA
jgi:5-methylcytosine-specific restriction endonuclease McrA